MVIEIAHTPWQWLVFILVMIVAGFFWTVGAHLAGKLLR